MVTRYTITSAAHPDNNEEVNNNQDVYKLSSQDTDEENTPPESNDLTTVYELNKNFQIEVNDQVIY